MLIEDSTKPNGLRSATEEERQMLRSSALDIDIDFKECILYPGSEVMIKTNHGQ